MQESCCLSLLQGNQWFAILIAEHLSDVFHQAQSRSVDSSRYCTRSSSMSHRHEDQAVLKLLRSASHSSMLLNRTKRLNHSLAKLKWAIHSLAAACDISKHMSCINGILCSVGDVESIACSWFVSLYHWGGCVLAGHVHRVLPSFWSHPHSCVGPSSLHSTQCDFWHTSWNVSHQ